MALMKFSLTAVAMTLLAAKVGCMDKTITLSEDNIAYLDQAGKIYPKVKAIWEDTTEYGKWYDVDTTDAGDVIKRADGEQGNYCKFILYNLYFAIIYTIGFLLMSKRHT